MVMATASQDNCPPAVAPPKGIDEPCCVREPGLRPTYSDRRRDNVQLSLTKLMQRLTQPWAFATSRQRRRALRYMPIPTAYYPLRVATTCRTPPPGRNLHQDRPTLQSLHPINWPMGMTTFPNTYHRNILKLTYPTGNDNHYGTPRLKQI